MAAPLPGELVYELSDDSKREGQKLMRTICKKWADIAAKNVFRTFHLKFCQASFDKLTNISLSPSLQRAVQEIVYDCRLLPWDLADFSAFETFFVRHRGFAIKIQKSSNKLYGSANGETMKEELGHAAMLHYYANYLLLLEGQKNLHRGNNELTSLSTALSHLPNLRSLVVDTGLCGTEELNNITAKQRRVTKLANETWAQALERSTLTDTARSCGIEPNFPYNDIPADSTHTIRRFAMLLSAANGRGIKRLEAGFLDVERMTRMDRLMGPPVRAIFPGLKHLSLQAVAFNKLHTSGALKLFEYVNEARRLATLELQVFEVGRGTPGPYADFNLDAISTLHLPVLHTLKLGGGAWVEENSLLKFLDNHAEKLRHVVFERLSITHSSLGDRSCLDAGPNLTIRDTNFGSWINVFAWMSANLTLRSVDIIGLMTNWWNESFFFKAGVIYGEKALVIDWILHGGSNPFVRRDQVERWENVTIEGVKEIVDVAYDLNVDCMYTCYLHHEALGRLVAKAREVGPDNRHKVYFADEVNATWDRNFGLSAFTAPELIENEDYVDSAEEYDSVDDDETDDDETDDDETDDDEMDEDDMGEHEMDVDTGGDVDEE